MHIKNIHILSAQPRHRIKALWQSIQAVLMAPAVQPHPSLVARLGPWCRWFLQGSKDRNFSLKPCSQHPNLIKVWVFWQLSAAGGGQSSSILVHVVCPGRSQTGWTCHHFPLMSSLFWGTVSLGEPTGHISFYSEGACAQRGSQYRDRE